MILIRYLALLVPFAALLGAAFADRSKAGRAGALLSFAGVMVGVAALNEVAHRTGWWRFADVEGTFRGVPVDLWLSWGILWGAVPVLLRRFIPVPVVLIGLLWLDLLAMPRMEPLLQLGPQWIVGEAVGILAVALPSMLAGRWSADRRRLAPRVSLQMIIFSALTLWLMPLAAFEFGDGSWARLSGLPQAGQLAVAQVALLLAIPALAAVVEFARHGGGTPYPWDPPGRLITTGPYAYVANPMQLSMVLLIALLSVLTSSWTVLAAAVCTAAFSAGVAAVHERHQLRERHGEEWMRYRRHVRSWLPRWRPYSVGRATLWLDEQCGTCAAVRDQFARRDSTDLVLAPAAEHPETLWLARYETAGSQNEDGVAAVARGMEHLHLGWAYAGWFLRLPGVGRLAQLISDALIVAPHPAQSRAGPQPARTEGVPCRTPSSDSSTAHCGPSGRRA